ncbi:hypothetical protein C4J81_09850 [Deltaproteobacteria bacterium Smac51]|nr:hypothetical protein C4J81_09850 [Deltaproteobacteria bacterium Smac51]
MKVLLAGSLEYSDCDQPAATLNVACGAPEDMKQARDVTWHYIPRNLPASWWLPTDVTTPASWWLAEYGWSIEDIFIGMALRPAPGYTVNFDSPPELTIVPCTTEEHICDVGRVIASPHVDEQPREAKVLAQAYRSAARPILAGEDGLKVWIGYVDGQPVSTIAAISQDNTAGMYGLTTVPECRHKNYAQATFFKALEYIVGTGCELITLQAASGGVTIYNEAGFIPVNQFVLWNNKALL